MDLPHQDHRPCFLVVVPDEPEHYGCRNDPVPLGVKGGTDDYRTFSGRPDRGGVPGRAGRRLRQPRQRAGGGRHPLPGHQHDRSASTPAGTAPAATPAGQAPAPRCHTSQLSVAFTGLNEASGGQRGMTLILTNRSGATCSVYGYTGLAFFKSFSVPMTIHLIWMKESHARVVLRPGGNAQALVTWRANTATGPAPFSPDIVHITPPDEYSYLQADWEGRPVRDARRRMGESMPDTMVDAFFQFFRRGGYHDSHVNDTIPDLLGRLPRTFHDWALAHAEAFR